MDKLELYMSELLMLKEMIENDIQMSSCGISEYEDVHMMQYYLDRAKVLKKIEEMIKQ